MFLKIKNCLHLHFFQLPLLNIYILELVFLEFNIIILNMYSNFCNQFPIQAYGLLIIHNQFAKKLKNNTINLSTLSLFEL